MGGRVLRIITRLNRGGPLRQLEALGPGLARLGWGGPLLTGRVEGHEADGTDDLALLGMDVVRVPSLRRGFDPYRDVKALKQLVHHVRAFAPDIVHTHLGKAGLLGRLAARWCGVPSIHTYHGHHFQAGFPREQIVRRMERTLGHLTTCVVVLTPRQRRDVVDIHRIVPASKVRVIAPGIDVEAVRRRAREAEVGSLRRRLVREGQTLFVWAGRQVGVKDPTLLVEALRRAPDTVRLVMLGGGPLAQKVRDRVLASGLDERVLLPGPVADPTPWIAAADAVVLSSRSEGASIFVLEAKALGKAAIVPTVGGLADIVEHGTDGLWVPPGDADALAAALGRLAGDPLMTRRLGAAAAEGVEARFGGERLARETAALYEEEAARQPGPVRCDP